MARIEIQSRHEKTRKCYLLIRDRTLDYSMRRAYTFTAKKLA